MIYSDWYIKTRELIESIILIMILFGIPTITGILVVLKKDKELHDLREMMYNYESYFDLRSEEGKKMPDELYDKDGVKYIKLNDRMGRVVYEPMPDQ